MHDYDTWVFFLPTFPAKVQKDSLFHALSVDYVYKALTTQTRIFVLGDPRGYVNFAEPIPARRFLTWTGYEFEWEQCGGDTITIDDNADEFDARRYLQKLKQWNYALTNAYQSDALNHARAVMNATRDKVQLDLIPVPLAVNRSQEQVSFALRLAVSWIDGRPIASHESIVFLPFGDLDPAFALDIMLKEIFGISIGQQPPIWVDELEAPGQSPIDESISLITTEIAQREADLELKLQERAGIRGCLRVLYQMGAALEEAVQDMLHTLGADVEQPENRVGCDRYLSVVIEGVKRNAAVEIKGTNKPQFDMKGFRQALQWRDEAMLARGEEHRPIFIGNSDLETPPNDRNDPFGDGWKKQAKLHKVTVLTTQTLFKAYCAKIEGTLKVEDFWKALFGTDGIFELDAALHADAGETEAAAG